VRHKSSTKSTPQRTDPTPVSFPNTLLPSEASAPIDLFLTDFDLERLTKRARSTWQKARLTGTGPRFVRLGRLVRYRASDVEAWLAARPSFRSTSEIPEQRITPEASRTVVPASFTEAAERGEAILKPQPLRRGRPRKQAA
jgi:predicted DNA-binding transcriptional regulator AlpA